MRGLRAVAGPVMALALLGSAPAPAPVKGAAWTRAWTASMWQMTDNIVTVDNATIRAAVKVGASGSAIRLRLSNEFGDVPLTIGRATIRLADGRSQALTFDGLPTARIAAGAPLVSDALELPVKAFEVVEVSIYLPEKTALTSVHWANGAPTQISATGDHTGDARFESAARTDGRPLIAGIDVRGPTARPVVVAFGDSITDNTGCANDAAIACRWGDVLGQQLAKAGKPHVVVTQAISGNRILTPGAGPNALARFDRDVLAVPGVSHVVILEGINDIGNSGLERDGRKAPEISAEQLIAGYRQLIGRAHDHGIKVIGLTVLPFKGAGYYAPEREAIRVKVNAWMRRSGAFDAVVDMEKVVADPNDPAKLAANLQGGDDLHPDGRGETKMGQSIPPTLFR